MIGMTYKKRKIILIIIYVLFLFIHLWLRTMQCLGLPPFEYRIFSCNWIPFFDFFDFLQQQGCIIAIGKILFYFVLGMLILLIMYHTQNKKRNFWFIAISTIILEELLNLTFNSSIVVVFNINNIILYLIGLLVANWLGFQILSVLQSKSTKPHN